MRKLCKIMCVDDEEDILEVAKMSLELDDDLVVVCCSSGNEALSAIEDTSPDLIMLDVMMPNMDGPATFKALRDSGRLGDTPVIFMTARVQRNEVEEYLKLGAIGVVAKPFDPVSLAGEVRGIWEKAAPADAL